MAERYGQVLQRSQYLRTEHNRNENKIFNFLVAFCRLFAFTDKIGNDKIHKRQTKNAFKFNERVL